MVSAPRAVVLAVFSAFAVASTTSSGALKQCLSHAVSKETTLVLPGSPAYLNATISNNIAFNYSAAAVAFVSDEDDVSSVIECAARYHTAVASRCARHSYASFGSGGQDGSVVIDVTNLKGTHYDESTGLATVGTGLRLGDLALFLDQHGRGTPHGTCPYVGLGGHSTCGGFGMWSRKHGLLIDQIVSATVATASGKIVTASKTHNADLFWAIRGAGPSFGSVLSLTIKTYPQPPRVTRFVLPYPTPASPAEAVAFFNAFQSFAQTQAPPELGMRILFVLTGGSMALFIHGVYYGPKVDFEAAFQPLASTLPTSASTFNATEMSYLDVIKTLDSPLTINDHLSSAGVEEPAITSYTKSILVPKQYPLSTSTWESFANYTFTHVNLPAPLVAILAEIDIFGGTYNGKPTGVVAVPPEENAFGGRDGLLMFQLLSISGVAGAVPPEAFDLMNGWEASITEKVKAEGKSTKAYACYVDQQWSAQKAHAKYFGAAKTAKLTAIKRKWDPRNVFQYPHGF